MIGISTATSAVFLLLALAAWNTIEGMGEDLQGGGEAISDTAADTKARQHELIGTPCR